MPNQARDHGKQGAACRTQAVALLHVLGIASLAGHARDVEPILQMRIAAGVPAVVDAMGNAAEPPFIAPPGEDSLHAAAECFAGDFPGVGFADRGDVAGVADTGLEERQPAVELHAFRQPGLFRQAEFGGAAQRAGSLVAQVMDGQHAGRRLPAPGHVGRRQGCRPVVGVKQVRAPVETGHAGGDIGGGQAQAGEADVIVRPFLAMLVAIGRTGPVVEFGADQHVDPQAVLQLYLTDIAGGDGGHARQTPHHAAGDGALEHLRIGGQQDADIMFLQ
ncbi:hypothetical protein D3C81_891230 [compost metagenome]